MRSLRQAHRPRRLSLSLPSPSGPAVRVALDLLGGDRAPEAVVDGALLAAAEQPTAPRSSSSDLRSWPPGCAARSAAGAFEVVPASQVVGMAEDPARAVRSKPDATVRVAALLVRDGRADAFVSVGSTGATVSAAVLTLGRLAGVEPPRARGGRPAETGPLVLLDVGASVDPTADLLAQFALAGSALAQVRLGLAAPRVGLLTIGEEFGKGDRLRKQADALLATLPVRYVGSVGRDVPRGGVADVVVTDAFTGNVLTKGLEGAAGTLADAVVAAFTATAELAAAPVLRPVLAELTARMSPTRSAAASWGCAASAWSGTAPPRPGPSPAVSAAATSAARDGLLPRTAEVLAALEHRRANVAP